MAAKALYSGADIGALLPNGFFRKQASKTTNYQILNKDNGALFDNNGAGGAVTFTLPAITKKKAFGFYVYAGQNVTISSKEGSNIVAPNNATASNIAFTTSGQLIGSFVTVFSDAAGTSWLVDQGSNNTMTVS